MAPDGATAEKSIVPSAMPAARRQQPPRRQYRRWPGFLPSSWRMPREASPDGLKARLSVASGGQASFQVPCQTIRQPSSQHPATAYAGCPCLRVQRGEFLKYGYFAVGAIQVMKPQRIFTLLIGFAVQENGPTCRWHHSTTLFKPASNAQDLEGERCSDVLVGQACGLFQHCDRLLTGASRTSLASRRISCRGVPVGAVKIRMVRMFSRALRARWLAVGGFFCSTDSPCHSAAVLALKIERLGSRESGHGQDAACILSPSPFSVPREA